MGTLISDPIYFFPDHQTCPNGVSIPPNFNSFDSKHILKLVTHKGSLIHGMRQCYLGGARPFELISAVDHRLMMLIVRGTHTHIQTY